MNTKTLIAFASAAGFAALLGCSTPKPASVSVPEHEVSIDLPLEPTPETFARVCKLGTSCLEMDPRPFEPCLLSTKSCGDKAAEPILVGEPPVIAPPLIIETAR